MISTLGERLRTIRKSNKLNQVEFATIIGVSQGTLSEQDKYKPSLDTIIALNERLNTDIKWLIFGNENKIGNEGVFNVAIKGQEIDLISIFRELSEKDKDEIIQFIKLKLSRY